MIFSFIHNVYPIIKSMGWVVHWLVVTLLDVMQDSSFEKSHVKKTIFGSISRCRTNHQVINDILLIHNVYPMIKTMGWVIHWLVVTFVNVMQDSSFEKEI